jgi:transmembrane sensor
MSEPDSEPPANGQLLREAAAWFARMRGPDAEASRGEFEAWLARGALHRRAYNRAAEIFTMGKLIGDDAASSERRWIGKPGLLQAAIIAGIGLLLIAIAGSWVVLRESGRDQPSALIAEGRSSGIGIVQLATGAGDSRAVRLDDGSVLNLAPDTTVTASFTGASRRLELERGSARFQVAHEQRPFMVFAGGGSVTAHGTIFEVGLAADRRVSVRLIEGVVDVMLPLRAKTSGARQDTRRLHPGEMISFEAQNSGGFEAGSREGHAAQDYDGIRIAELIALANGGASPKIRLDDPAVGLRRVSGRFRVDDTKLLAERLAALFDLAIDQPGPGEIVLRAR